MIKGSKNANPNASTAYYWKPQYDMLARDPKSGQTRLVDHITHHNAGGAKPAAVFKRFAPSKRWK